MGLRCLLGHDFGDAEIEREREEDGDEMVVTIREVETCRRCGAERIISENKEVTSIRTAEEIGLETDEDATAPPDQADDATSETAGESEPAAGRGDTADRDDPAGRGDTASQADSAAGATADADPAGDGSTADAGPVADASSTAGEEFDDPDGDDGVILSEDEEQRGHGEWPEAEQEGGSGAPQSGSDPEPDSENVTHGEGTQPSAGVDADAEAAPEADDQTENGPAGQGDEPTDQTDEQPSVADGEDDDVEILDADDDDTIEGATSDTRSSPDGDASDGAADSAESSADEAGEAAAWPDHGGEDEGFDAEIAGDEDVSFSGNSLTPDVEADAPGADAEYVETDADTGHDSTDRVAESTRQTDVDTGIAREGAATVDLSEVSDDAEFYCPNCGLSRGSSNSSMRPGDICPECRKGYIAER